ncbi:MAG TPA: DnaB-like helicase C-terminal domain-containing protein [Syntrophales bacterium]|nr:DnaB-like helicase C-terminal domain-containing protein [Syntrophales bacterium]
MDYLQLVRPSQRWGTREAEVAEVSRSLKALAKALKKYQARNAGSVTKRTGRRPG